MNVFGATGHRTSVAIDPCSCAVGNATETSGARPHAAAILYENRRYTHRDVHELSNRSANWLASLGVRNGDVISVLLENRPETLLIIAGIVKAKGHPTSGGSSSQPHRAVNSNTSLERDTGFEPATFSLGKSGDDE